MATQANIDDIDALKRLRAQVAKFAETMSVAVTDAQSDVNRTLQWLDMEQALKWKTELRKRHEKHQQALEQLRMKQLYKGPSGERQSSVDEQHRVKQCRAALDEAEAKLKAIAAHKVKLGREAVLFHGTLGRLSAIAHQSAPAALADLTNALLALEKYRTSGVLETTSSAGPSEAGATAGEAVSGMARQTDAVPGEEEVKVDWDAFIAHARAALAKVQDPEALMEAQATFSGAIAIWKDGFTGRIFIGSLLPLAPDEKADFTPLTRDALLEALPGVADTLSNPGDRRALFKGGEPVMKE